MHLMLAKAIAAATALACAAVSPCVAVAQGAPVRIRMGTLAPQGSSYHRILQAMGEKWKTATNIHRLA